MNENYFHQHQDVREENGIQYGDLPEFVDYEYTQKVLKTADLTPFGVSSP